jgi:predicted AAA+ superfamily ATPase
MYPRHVLPILLEALQDTPVVLLNGARQTGKSTLAQQCLAGQSHRYLTFDDPVVLAAVKHDAAGFIDVTAKDYLVQAQNHILDNNPLLLGL